MRIPLIRSVLAGLAALACVLPSCGSSGGTRASPLALLANLTASMGTLDPAFDPEILVYTVEALSPADAPTLTATPEEAGAMLWIDGVLASAGVPSAPIDLPVGTMAVPVRVRNASGDETEYTIVFKQAVTAVDAYVKAFTVDVDDRFGRDVAIDGDTLAVSTDADDSNATGIDGDETDDSAADAGAVCVYVNIAGVWTRQAYVKASNTGAGDLFGASIALHGDTLVVGAPGENSAATGVDGNETADTAASSGAAYVFVRTGGIWAQQAYLKASNTDSGDRFGLRVALHGDTLVVGAPREDSMATGVGGDETDDSETDSGAAYVFVRSAGVWSQQAYLKASNTGAGDRFGQAVDIQGDTIVVGASFEASAATGVGGNHLDNSAPDSGAAYVFARSAGGWSQEAYLKASNTDPQDEFGQAVAVHGDTVAVGAFREGPIDSFSGAVYVFVRDQGSWTHQQRIKATPSGSGDWFGISLDIRHDTLLVGASNEDSSATDLDGDPTDDSTSNDGAAYVLCRVDGIWTQVHYLKSPNPDAGDFFGGAVALGQDVLVVGEINDDSGATGVGGDPARNDLDNAGGAHVFR